MAAGDIHEATAGESTDIYYVDTGMYGIGEYGSVYILDTDRPALVDTGIGSDYDLVLDALADVGVDPDEVACIVPTHVHLDHAGGAGYLAAECPNADVYVHEIGAPHLVDPERLWAGTTAVVGDMIEYYAQPEPLPEDRVVELSDGDTVDLGDRTLDVHHVPGHAPHQVALYDPVSDGVFTADAAGSFAPGLERPYPETAPPSFDLEQCLADVETLQSLDPSALYFGHFGAWEPEDRLTAYATELQEWVTHVEATRDRLGDDDAVVEQFLEEATTDRRTDAIDAWGERKARSKTRMNVRGMLTYLDS